MPITYLRILITGAIFLTLSHPALACKMSAIGGSTATLKAVLDTVAADPELSDHTIKRIKYLGNNWQYVVETTQGEEICQATGYSVSIDPSCKIAVQQLTKHFWCEK